MKWLINLFEGGRNLERLNQWLGKIEWPESWDYRSFEIRKRNGGKRLIEAPNEKLKALQVRTYELLLKYLKPHPSCVGFVPRLSIVEAAKIHVDKEVIINLDLKDFFHSITEKRVYRYFRGIGWGRTAAKMLTKICCHRGRLPMGAPTSPMLSNVINYQMDERINKLAGKLGGQYTRYADDITLSFDEFGSKQKIVLKVLPGILNDYGFVIQKKKKVRIQRRHQRQTVVGLVVNKKVNLPRWWRKKLRAMKHQGKIDKNKMRGYEGLMKMVEMRR